jgi:hypothetical protein
MKYILRTFFLHIRYSIITILLFPLFFLYFLSYYYLFKSRKKSLESFLKNTKIINFGYYDHQFCYFNNFINPDQDRLNQIISNLKLTESQMTELSRQLFALSELNRKMSSRFFQKKLHYSGHSIKYNKNTISMDWIVLFCDLFINFPLIIQTQFIDKYSQIFSESYKRYFIKNILTIILDANMCCNKKANIIDELSNNQSISELDKVIQCNKCNLNNTDLNKINLNLGFLKLYS